MISKGTYEVRGIKYPVDGLFMHQIKASKVGDVVYCTLRDTPTEASEEAKMKEATREYANRFKTNSLRTLVLREQM